MPQAREPRQVLAGRRVALVAKIFDRGDGRLLKQRAALEAAGAEVGCFAMTDHARSAPGVTTPDWRAARTRTALTGGIVLAAGVFAARLASRRAPGQAASDASAWLAYRGQVRALADALAAWRPDVVVCSDPETLPAMVQLKASRGGAVLYDAHEFHEEEDHTDPGRQAWVRKVETLATGSIDGFVTVNAGIAALYAARRPGLPPAAIVHNAGELETPPAYDGRLHRAAELPASTRILLFQGGLAPMRGLEALVDAGALLPDGWALVLMGSGRLEAELRARADAGRVRFVAPAPFTELPQWTVGAALGALLYEDLNLNQRHCSPNKLWEYPAAGVPMLATDLPEIRRLAAPYGVAFFVPSGAGAAEIAARVAGLTDEDLAKARAGAAAFTRLHSWRANAETFVSEVARLADR